jgi:hypothetical protein
VLLAVLNEDREVAATTPCTVFAVGFNGLERAWRYLLMQLDGNIPTRYWRLEEYLQMDHSRMTTQVPPVPKYRIGAPVTVRVSEYNRSPTSMAVVHSVRMAQGGHFQYQAQEVDSLPPYIPYAGLCDDGKWYLEGDLILDETRTGSSEVSKALVFSKAAALMILSAFKVPNWTDGHSRRRRY